MPLSRYLLTIHNEDGTEVEYFRTEVSPHLEGVHRSEVRRAIEILEEAVDPYSTFAVRLVETDGSYTQVSKIRPGETYADQIQDWSDEHDANYGQKAIDGINLGEV